MSIGYNTRFLNKHISPVYKTGVCSKHLTKHLVYRCSNKYLFKVLVKQVFYIDVEIWHTGTMPPMDEDHAMDEHIMATVDRYSA